jgi:hypothetical protein
VSEVLCIDISKLYDKIKSIRTYWLCLRLWHSLVMP